MEQSKISYALKTLRKYKDARVRLNHRIKSEEAYWRSRYSGNREIGGEISSPASSWLFNSISNKHADLLDNLPTCTCLPREKADEGEARMLSQVVPVITQRNDFSRVYSDNTWKKLKHGMAVYGVFWNQQLDSGLGDIEIKSVDIKRLYWEPGVDDIEDSRNVFYISYEDEDLIEYREMLNTDGAGTMSYGDDQATDGKIRVIDWYYKTVGDDGEKLLCFCRFTDKGIIYSSEDEGKSWYSHGQYPFVLDILYPGDNGTEGFGVISIAKNPQEYLDRMDKDLLEYMDWATTVRFWAKRSLGINEKKFLDLDNRIVEVEGDIDNERLKQITVGDLDDQIIKLKEMKIDELKETSGNRDISQGSSAGGVTAAAAIAALQEAGNKSIRDCVFSSYKAYERIILLVIELIREFYNEPRCFRIVGDDRRAEFVSYSNAGIAANTRMGSVTGYMRKPIFDISVKTLRRNPTSQSAKNEFAMRLYESGAFKRENSRETLIMLEMMDFDGYEKIRDMVMGEAGYNDQGKGIL